MTQNLIIRRADVGDAKLLSLLSAVTFSDTFTGTCTAEDMRNYIRENYAESVIENELEDMNDFYFIAYLNDKPVGYMRIKEEKSDVPVISRYKSIELKRIYVLKEYHAKKVGAAMMDFAFDFAKEKKYRLMWLGVWEHNERAKAFYKKYGFIETGNGHPFPIGNTPQTDIWLYKMLTT